MGKRHVTIVRFGKLFDRDRLILLFSISYFKERSISIGLTSSRIFFFRVKSQCRLHMSLLITSNSTTVTLRVVQINVSKL